jgi:hypothetical protein
MSRHRLPIGPAVRLFDRLRSLSRARVASAWTRRETSPKSTQVIVPGGGKQFSIGERVRLATNVHGTRVDVVSDPVGQHVVVSRDSSVIEIRRIGER